ncbi:hypothetical protein IGI04_016082, partial [Brassica rapa subsp. trilocularis]
KMSLSASTVPQTGVSGVYHSIFESLRLGSSSQNIISGLPRFWNSLNFKKNREFMGITVLFLDEKVNTVIYGFIPARRANHYMSSLKACSIVKVDRFEVTKCSSMYNITDHPFLIRIISPTIIDEVITSAPQIISNTVGQVCFVQCSDLTKKTTRVVIWLLIDPETNTATPGDTRDNPDRHKGGNNISTCSLLWSYENSLSSLNRPMLLFSYEKYIYSFKTHYNPNTQNCHSFYNYFYKSSCICFKGRIKATS